MVIQDYKEYMYNTRFQPRGSFKQNFRRKANHQTLSKRELLEAIRSGDALKTAFASIATDQSPTDVVTHKFSDFDLNEKLLENILKKGYEMPTPIQDQSISAILKGDDVIGIANTGTGKTGAFLIPLIQKVSHNKSEKALIIAPTRELAVQIYEEFRELCTGLGIHASLCIGGLSLVIQKNELRQQRQLVIGTPGRIKDLIMQRGLNLATFTTVVLDEADRMVDIGFIADIKYFISLLPKNRQSLFFSATISPKVKEVIDAFVTDPVTISVKKQETSANVEQKIITVPADYQKIDHLHDLLLSGGFEKVLIFGRTKWGVQKLGGELEARGFKIGVIHGNKTQGQRMRVLSEFKKNTINILLATDVASRGLDISDVSHVINYEMPATYDDYVHRIGRTGRANKTGVALTFVD